MIKKRKSLIKNMKWSKEMKKKIIILLVAITSVFVLAACSSGNGKTESNTPSAGAVNSSCNKENNNLLGATFENDTLTNSEVVIKLTGHEIGTSEDGKPVLRVFFDFTNNSSEAYKVAYVPQRYFDPIQNTGAFTEHLKINLSPDAPKYAELNEVFHKDVNTGYTVKSLAEYELVNTSTPVEFIIFGNDSGDEIARKTYEIK